YDSAGIALVEEHALEYVRAVGNLANLKRAAGDNGSPATTGLGHTRWATHGAVSEENAHPLTGCDEGKLAIVLNGIVENYLELKNELEADGHVFSSATDAEVVAHVLEKNYRGDLAEAARATSKRLEGHFTFVVIDHEEPERLVGVRHQTPLVVGLGDGESFIASNVAAFLRETKRVQYPHDGLIVDVRRGYETFMLKEIYEQPDAIRETIGERVRHGRLVRDGFGMSEQDLRELRRIVIVACGTAYHAGVVGRYVIEEWGRVPVEPDIASEWIYRNPVLDEDTLVIGISQSGETRDTIHAMLLARELGARTVA